MDTTDIRRFAHARLCLWGENRAHDLEGLGWPSVGQLEQMRQRAHGGGASTSGDSLTLLEGQAERRGRTLSVECVVVDLPETQRQVLYARFVSGKRPGAIAEMLGAKPDTVRDRLERAVLAVGRALIGPQTAENADCGTRKMPKNTMKSVYCDRT